MIPTTIEERVERLEVKLENHEHRAPLTTYPVPQMHIWEMYNAGPTGWRCAKNHPGYFEVKMGAKVVFGCTTCGVSFERSDHQMNAIKQGHTVYALPVVRPWA